jgi:hypothetical protein
MIHVQRETLFECTWRHLPSHSYMPTLTTRPPTFQHTSLTNYLHSCVHVCVHARLPTPQRAYVPITPPSLPTSCLLTCPPPAYLPARPPDGVLTSYLTYLHSCARVCVHTRLPAPLRAYLPLTPPTSPPPAYLPTRLPDYVRTYLLSNESNQPPTFVRPCRTAHHHTEPKTYTPARESACMHACLAHYVRTYVPRHLPDRHLPDRHLRTHLPNYLPAYVPTFVRPCRTIRLPKKQRAYPTTNLPEILTT